MSCYQGWYLLLYQPLCSTSLTETNDLKSRFEELYIKYSQLMYAVAFKILKNNEDAEDAVHQSFLNIARHFEKVNNISRHDIKPYLVVVVRNAAINIHRSNKQRENFIQELSAKDIVEAETFDNYCYKELVEAIKQLPIDRANNATHGIILE